MKPAVLLPLFACAVCAQNAPPAFEVASVKVSAPFTPGRGQVIRGCGKPDPAMVHCTGTTLKILLMRAYDVKQYQIQGPDWLNTENYDLMAKVPEGVPADKVPAMLQALLAERFGVKVHKETRVLPAYELSVGKGPKMKEVDVAKLPGIPEPGSAFPPPPPPGGRGSGPPPVSSMPVGAVMMMFGPNGTRIVRGNMTMEQFSNYLSNSVSRPVLDDTGLKGTYEIELSYLADETDGMMIPGGGGGRAMDGGGREGPPLQDASAPTATLSQAVQTLGLKLEAKKAPVDMIVIDSANKVPTEN